MSTGTGTETLTRPVVLGGGGGRARDAPTPAPPRALVHLEADHIELRGEALGHHGQEVGGLPPSGASRRASRHLTGSVTRVEDHDRRKRQVVGEGSHRAAQQGAAGSGSVAGPGGGGGGREGPHGGHCVHPAAQLLKRNPRRLGRSPLQLSGANRSERGSPCGRRCWGEGARDLSGIRTVLVQVRSRVWTERGMQ